MVDPDLPKDGRNPDDPAAAHAEDAAGPTPIPVADDGQSFVQLIPQFFIFPLVLVTVGVLVYVFFIASAQDHRSASDLINDLQSGWDQTKSRAAFELAMRTRDREQRGEGERFTVEETERIVQLIERSNGGEKVRSWLIYALGRGGAETVALPALLRILGAGEAAGGAGAGAAAVATSPLEDRVEAVRGLGLSRSPRAVEPLVAQLATFRGEEYWEPRQITLSALANVALGTRIDDAQRQQILDVLREHVADPHWSVRWNLAVILAREFADPTGVETLRSLLERDFLEERVAEPTQQEPWMVSAIDALAELGDRESYAKIERLSGDPSARVRNAVFLFLKRLRESGEEVPSSVSSRGSLPPAERSLCCCARGRRIRDAGWIDVPRVRTRAFQS